MKELQSNGFYELQKEEIELVNGGGARSALMAFGGGLLVAFTPLGCVVGGPAVGAGMFGLGCSALDYACDNPEK